jgi:hypothetical protein
LLPLLALVPAALLLLVVPPAPMLLVVAVGEGGRQEQHLRKSRHVLQVWAQPQAALWTMPLEPAGVQDPGAAAAAAAAVACAA